MQRFTTFLLLALSFCFIKAFAQPANLQHRINLDPGMRPFYHGVASGDPMHDQVIIWTRVTPDSSTTGDITVYWQIATDTNFSNIVNYGKLTAKPQNDYCVKTDVCGLAPATHYYFLFQANGRNSIIGRTKTTPAPNANNDSVRLAVVSCADYENGFFNAYESISNRNDVEAVVHLGDYIYEYETGGIAINNPGRTVEPANEIISLSDYRIRHSHYKLDNQLRRLHQLYPMVAVWDDHELCNNSWRDGADNHQPATEGPYPVRKFNATSTYFDWMPLRKPDPLDTLRIFRKIRYGKLMDLIMLDTRLYDRDEPNQNASNSPNHKLMGPVAMNWFLQQLSDSSTQWKVIGNQVMFAPLTVFGQPVNSDQWDGYNFERQQIQNHILQNNIKDVVILTGDIHTSWCNDVPGSNYNANTGQGSVCVEFVGPSVTSSNSPLPVGINIIKSLNPHMKYIDLDNHGYYVLDVKKGKAQADYVYVQTGQLGSNNTNAAAYFVNSQERHLRSTTPITNAPKLNGPVPSTVAKQNIGVLKITDKYVVTDENVQVTENIIPSAIICPGVAMAVITPPANGAVVSLNGRDITYVPNTNFYGDDTIVYQVCTIEQNPQCDTITVYITVNQIKDIQVVAVTILAGDSNQSCVTFDDLTSAPVTIQHTVPVYGQFTLTDSCFTYQSPLNFCGSDSVFVYGCTATECDTVLYIFTTGVTTHPDTYQISVLKNSNHTQCPAFNDLIPPVISKVVLKNPTNGTLQWQGDTCIKYFPYFNYTGTDTVVIAGCDGCTNNHCDTTTMIFTIEEPNSLQEANDLIVFGMYPTVVADKVIIQFYLQQVKEVQFNIYNIQGKLISTDTYKPQQAGLLYAQVNCTELPAATYIMEVKAGNQSYKGKIIKQ